VRARAAALIGTISLALVVLLAGCEGDRNDARKSAPRTVEETVDPLPNLLPGWSEHVNRHGGFAIGVPPGWSASAHGARSELRSPERLAAVSIGVDRTSDAIDAPLERFAAATLKAGLPGVSGLDAGSPRPFRHPYQAVSVEATGVAGEAGLAEDLELVLIRRDGLATYTALVAQNAERGRGVYAAQIDQMLATLRGRPIGARS
jgi:hypothetical protein